MGKGHPGAIAGWMVAGFLGTLWAGEPAPGDEGPKEGAPEAREVTLPNGQKVKMMTPPKMGRADPRGARGGMRGGGVAPKGGPAAAAKGAGKGPACPGCREAIEEARKEGGAAECAESHPGGETRCWVWLPREETEDPRPVLFRCPDCAMAALKGKVWNSSSLRDTSRQCEKHAAQSQAFAKGLEEAVRAAGPGAVPPGAGGEADD